jgi:hypothetical protein
MIASLGAVERPSSACSPASAGAPGACGCRGGAKSAKLSYAMATGSAPCGMSGFVTSGDVRGAKEKLNPTFYATDADVKACASLSATARVGWAAFLTAWQAFYAADDSFWTAGAEMDRVEAWASDLHAWQVKLAESGCTTSVPAPKPPEGSPWPSAIRWGAAAIIAVAAVYAARPLIVTLMPRGAR